MKREVVVTGLGVICSQATSPQVLFERLERGKSSVRNHPRFAEYGFPNPACAYIDDEIWRQLAMQQAHYAGHRRLGPPVRLALHAAEQALADSGIDIGAVGRKGLFVASNKYTLSEQQLLALAAHYDPVAERVDLDDYLRRDMHEVEAHFHKRQDMASLMLGALHDFDEGVMTHGDACAAGAIAIGTGYRHIMHGELDVALVGAAETMSNYIPMVGFAVLGALSQSGSESPETISRPFDKDRSGFVMGEGSAFLVLESRDHAQKRGAPILAKISGFAKHAEAWRITASSSDGSQYARCIRAALDDAGLSAEAIDHINAHGTSTKQNDSCESAAIRQVFGARAASIPVTANKSALGHSLAASGAIEAVLSIMSLQKQVLLPTLNFHEADADTAGLDIVLEARPAKIGHVVSNSFGFGGENCALVFSVVQ